jgi:hypothetical protein
MFMSNILDKGKKEYGLDKPSRGGKARRHSDKKAGDLARI